MFFIVLVDKEMFPSEQNLVYTDGLCEQYRRRELCVRKNELKTGRS